MTGPEATEIITRLGLTQSEFARLIGLSRMTPHLWAADKRRPSQTTAALLTLLDHDPRLMAVLKAARIAE